MRRAPQQRRQLPTDGDDLGDDVGHRDGHRADHARVELRIAGVDRRDEADARGQQRAPTFAFKLLAACVDTDHGYENRMDYPLELRMIGCVHLTTAAAG